MTASLPTTQTTEGSKITNEGAVVLERTPEGDDLLVAAQYEAKQSLKTGVPSLLIVIAALAAFALLCYLVFRIPDTIPGSATLFGGIFVVIFASVDSSWQRLKRISQEFSGNTSRTEKYYNLSRRFAT